MGLLVGTLNYYKGYKVNAYILESILKYSGYNDLSKKDINRIIKGIGYSSEVSNCPIRGDVSPVNSTGSYCIYLFDKDGYTKEDRVPYYSYGVTTFISIELPIVGKFKIPVFTKGRRMIDFNKYYLDNV